MECIYIVDAKHVKEFVVYLRFNDGKAGEVDLRDLIYKYNAAKPLRDVEKFKHFYLDGWPTLAWDCGFDVAPESLYSRILTESSMLSV